MKKIKLLILNLFVILNITAQNKSSRKISIPEPPPSYIGDVVLVSQKQVDSIGLFKYHEIEGKLTIEGKDITNLKPLETINYISNSIHIKNNPSLRNLNGLNNLETIGNDLTFSYLLIEDNPMLENLEGLKGLIRVRNIVIEQNALLQSLYGIRNIESGVESISISENNNLKSLLGLGKISQVSLFEIRENKSLKSLIGLDNLYSSEVGFSLLNNDSLENLNALSKFGLSNQLTIISNKKLNNFCGLSNLTPATLNNLIILDNKYNPRLNDFQNGRCSSNINFNLEYPKENDVYVVGRKIRLQFPQDVGIPTDSNIKLSYSFDNNTWVDGGSYTADNNLGEFLVTPNVTKPKDVFIKIQTTVNGNDLSFASKKVTIQPVNYYENLGFREDGVSEIDFPLEGYKGSDRGWVDAKGSRGHFCLDNFAIDFNYLNYFDKKDLTCGKTILAPFNGKIISIYNGKSINGEDYDSKLLCGGTLDEKYQFAGLHITIQSKENRNFAVIFAHLKNVSDKLSKGMEIKKGTFIGNVGGSGTESAHLHMAAYKNIYDWYPLINVNLTKTNTILEKISNGDTFFNKENIITCNDLIDNSAEVKFINKSNNNYHITSVFVETNAEFINILNSGKNFFLNDFTINFLKNKNISKKRNLENFELMKNVKSIDGSLKISNTNLTNLDDFKNITFIGGDLIISNNSNLSNYCGIFNLINNKGLTGKLIIEDNNENPTSEEILNMTDCKSTLNISDFKNDDFMIFPNPTKSELFIKGNDIYGKVVIYNINGKEIISFNSSDKINLKALSKGVYYLKLKKSNKTITRKFVKK